MMGRPNTAPNWPGLVTVKVEPSTSSGLSFFVRARFAEIGDAALQSEEVQVVGVLQDGNNQSPIERDGDADVYVAVVTDAFAFHRCVNDGELLQGDDGRAHEKRHEGKAGAVALLESGSLVCCAG